MARFWHVSMVQRRRRVAKQGISSMKALLMTGASLFALTGAASAATIGYTGAVYDYTVAVSGTYDIVAAGAQGGDGGTVNYPDGAIGGAGAIVSGDVYLASGTVLQIAVGGVGHSGPSGNETAGGGGGGTFILNASNNPLLVAGGGGGGAPVDFTFSAGGPGQTTTSGQDGLGFSYGGAGGTGGSGGKGGSLFLGGDFLGGNGGGGAGLYGSGGNGAGRISGKGGSGFPTFAGGAGLFGGSDGGFGGGGGGGNGGGGGGGFSGGGGGFEGGGPDGWTGGGGGGSYIAPEFSSPVLTAGAHDGNGYVSISEVIDVPEPVSAALLGSGIAGLGFVRRRFVPQKS
jgi:hypothetical protein